MVEQLQGIADQVFQAIDWGTPCEAGIVRAQRRLVAVRIERSGEEEASWVMVIPAPWRVSSRAEKGYDSFEPSSLLICCSPAFIRVSELMVKVEPNRVVEWLLQKAELTEGTVSQIHRATRTDTRLVVVEGDLEVLTSVALLSDIVTAHYQERRIRLDQEGLARHYKDAGLSLLQSLPAQGNEPASIWGLLFPWTRALFAKQKSHWIQEWISQHYPTTQLTPSTMALQEAATAHLNMLWMILGNLGIPEQMRELLSERLLPPGGELWDRWPLGELKSEG